MLPLLRLTLDLFEINPPQALINQTQVAPVIEAVLVPSASPASTFRHPRASREIHLGAALVAYSFTRSQRRTIGFGVGPDGLEVRAPKWVALREVDAVLKDKAPWILRKLQHMQQRQTQLANQIIDWRDGAQLPYLGQTLTVVLDPVCSNATSGAQLSTQDPDGPVLRISLAHTASAQQIRDRVQAWLMRQARAVFQQRLDHFAPLLGVQWTKLSLSNAGTRWGSARSDGSIRLNWRLLHFNVPVLDYVVVHELSHLRVMNHSPRFWDTVAAVVPDYKTLRQQLKTETAPNWLDATSRADQPAIS